MNEVIIKPDNIVLQVKDEEDILSVGLAQELNLPHRCKNGRCGACKCKVISGDITLKEYNPLVLTDEEVEQGYTLLCKAMPKSTVELDIPNLLNGYPVKIITSYVSSIERAQDIAIIKLKLNPKDNFKFFPGQYVDVIVNGKNRSYSLASSSQTNDEIELHVKYRQGGLFSEKVWQHNSEEKVKFRGPFGNFQLQESNKPIIMICTGTGFAPLKSMMLGLIHAKSKRNIYFYWGNRELDNFYYLDLIKNWQEELNLTVSLCLSQEEAPGFYNGRVTKKLLQDFNSLENFEVYACGNINMVEEIFKLCTENLQLLKENFFSDIFSPSVE